MEIDKVIKECDDRRLKNKYNSAIYVIRRALALYSVEEMAFSFNGGKDSTVLLHLLRAGYYLHREENGHVNGDLKDFPIRTIYFETSSAFPEINTFTYHTASTYGLQMDIIRTDVKSGLDALLKAQPIKAILLGVRIGDPTAVGQEQFSPSSPGWPPFMRVNPILDWSYRDIWAFLLTCKVPYCSLYDQGYTSIGSIHDTVPNALLCMSIVSGGAETFRPAYMLSDGRLERAGRVKKVSSSHQCPATANNGFTSVTMGRKDTLSAAIIVVGDEILSSIAEDQLGPSLCRKLHSIGWSIHHVAVVRNDIDHIAEEVERRKSTNDMVFLYGGVGPLHSDVSLAGVAKAFGVRLAPDEEFEDSLEHLNNKQSTGTGNEMALLPEGITELLHHENLPVPLIKCENVIVLSATNVSELDRQWGCLIDISRSSGLIQLLEPFAAKSLRINLPDVEVAQLLSKLCLEFPDLSIGCHRESWSGPLVISIKGKDGSRIDSALEVLRKKFPAETLYGKMDAGDEKPVISAGGDDTATPLNGSRAANLKVAASDQDMTHIMKHIKSTKSPVIINYGAAWCRVCSQILPAFVRFVDEFPKLSFVYADIDECPETTQHVRYTPTFHFYRDGERVDEMFGAGEERLHDRLWLHS